MTTIKNKFRSTLVANFDRMDVVEGRILSIDTAEFEGEERRFLLVDTEDALVKVFETMALTDAFNVAAIGDCIRIKYLATVATKNKRTFKQFDARVWTDDSLPAIDVKAKPGPKRAASTRK